MVLTPRQIDVLNCIADINQQHLSATTVIVAARLGFNHVWAWKLFKSLSEQGMIERIGTGYDYALTRKGKTVYNKLNQPKTKGKK